MRDYVKYWYNDLSDDAEFLHSLQLTLNEVVRVLATRYASMLVLKHPLEYSKVLGINQSEF